VIEVGFQGDRTFVCQLTLPFVAEWLRAGIRSTRRNSCAMPRLDSTLRPGPGDSSLRRRVRKACLRCPRR
jgi:hypothetical protein